MFLNITNQQKYLSYSDNPIREKKKKTTTEYRMENPLHTL